MIAFVRTKTPPASLSASLATHPRQLGLLRIVLLLLSEQPPSLLARPLLCCRLCPPLGYLRPILSPSPRSPRLRRWRTVWRPSRRLLPTWRPPIYFLRPPKPPQLLLGSFPPLFRPRSLVFPLFRLSRCSRPFPCSELLLRPRSLLWPRPLLLLWSLRRPPSPWLRPLLSLRLPRQPSFPQPRPSLPLWLFRQPHSRL
jgi:hypothetical protein